MRNIRKSTIASHKFDSFVFTLWMMLTFMISGYSLSRPSDDHLEKNFITPPREAKPVVLWWWLNSYISKEGVTRDLEQMKRQGIGGALIFDAAPVDRWRSKNVEPAPVGPAFMSDAWREVFRHAMREANRLDLELGVSITSGFNAGGPWVTPEFGQQELVWSETEVKGPAVLTIPLPLPSGPIYDNNGNLLKYNEMEVNNDVMRDEAGNPIHFRDMAVLAVKVLQPVEHIREERPSSEVPPGRLKNWALKSVHSFDYPVKEGFLFGANYEDIPDMPDEPRFPGESMIDISRCLNKEGILNWNAPEGDWLILRLGHTHTGIRLQATNPQNEGLAMNHLSAEAAERHFSEIALKMLEDREAVNGKCLTYFYLDSWEVRIANWTDDFLREFRQRRGYDPLPFLPVLTGRIVDNREISNRFLHDYRETIGDCIADNYYGKFRELCNNHGMEFHSEMATTPIPADMLKCMGRCDVPVGEFWAETDLEQGRVEPWERMFGKQVASAAHIYGSSRVAAEALTVIQKHWEHSPYDLKRTLDQGFCAGLNNIVIHTFTHSPPEVKAPGYEYFAGTHFNPQITWWEQAHAFTDYISRCQFLLQQGHFVADVCFFQGSEIPAFVPMKHIDPRLGPGYDYDVVNAEVIEKRMTVRDGRIVLPDGMSYHALVLPDVERIQPRVLRKISELVQAGANVIGPKPKKAYGLENYPACDSIVQELADKLWGNADLESEKERIFGNGKIVWGTTVRDVLTDDHILPDFEVRGLTENIRVDFMHRRISGHSGQTDMYFVANFDKDWQSIECTFRVGNKTPELWDPETGGIRELTVFDTENGRTILPLELPPLGSIFVVFRKPVQNAYISKILCDSLSIFPALEGEAITGNALVIVPGDNNTQLLEARQPGAYRLINNNGDVLDLQIEDIPASIPIEGPWIVHFPENLGAPDSTALDTLISWTDSEDSGIRYFSGSAVYTTSFEIDGSMLNKESKLCLDLGDVHNISEARLNGHPLGIRWKPPYRMDVTSCLKPGKNVLEVNITNLWPNRIIGDQFLPPDQRITFTNIGKFTKDSPLLESGLLGPVRLIITPLKNIRL